MRRIFLHAGEPKTGTTAIQMLLRDSREALSHFGYLVPKTGVTMDGKYNGLIDTIIGRPAPAKFAQCDEAFRQEVKADPSDNVIVSAESLDIIFRRNESRDKILSFFRELGFATTVVVFIRPDAEVLNSSYVQQAKSFLFDHTLREFIVGRRRYFHLDALAQLPGIETIFRPYNAEVRRAGVAREFLRVIGLPEEAIQCLGPERRVNESIGPIAIAAAAEIRRRIQQTGRQPTDRQRRVLKKELFRLIEQEAPESPFYGIDAELREDVERCVAKDREKFAQRAWGKSWEAVFPPDPEASKRCNAFNAATAEPEAMKRYERMTAALWSAAQRIMNDPKHAKADAWDALHRQAFLWMVHFGAWSLGFCTSDLPVILSLT